MKKLLLFGIFFIYVNGFSQNYFFVDKKGIKTIIQDTSFDLVIKDERIQYVPEGKKWEKYIKFKDIDYGLFGSYYFKSFKLKKENGNSKRETAFFVLAETAERKLLAYAYTVIGKYSSVDFYEVYVIDNNNVLLDFAKVNTGGSDTDERAEILPFIKKHFSNCKVLLDEFSKYDDTDKKHLNILGFFDNLSYRKCE